MDSMQKNLACVIAYDGSKFYGSAKQAGFDSYPTVVGLFENTLKTIGINTQVISSSRTDKGVHATYQVLNFYARLYMPLERIQKLLNEKLFPYIRVKKIYEVAKDFHARFHAKARYYKYIFTRAALEPFYTHYIASLSYGCESILKQALKEFEGEHDFSFFKKEGGSATNPIRRILKASLFKAKLASQPCLVAHIGAPGFLRSQVRLMISASIEASFNRISLEAIRSQLRGHSALEPSPRLRKPAPACGLYLTRVIY